MGAAVTFSKAIRDYLQADSSIAALVSEEIYPVRYPQIDQSTAQFPAILHRLIRAETLTPMEAGPGQADILYRTLRQFEIISETYDEVETLSGLVNARLHGLRGTFTDAGPDLVVQSCLLNTASDQIIVGDGANPFELFVRALQYEVVTRGASPL